jgi:hypothetical protein
MDLFTTFPGDSRLWIYQANRELTLQEFEQINIKLKSFIKSWQAHRQQLFADAIILYNFFILFAVDEKQAKASGCSIDSSVNFVKNLENEYNLSFLDRSLITYRDTQNKIQLMQRLNVPQALRENVLNSDTLVFNNTIQTLTELNKWETTFKNSWHGDAFL